MRRVLVQFFFQQKKRQGLPLSTPAVNLPPPLPRPRMHFDDVRPPDDHEWAVWVLMPELRLWEAVALLCGIEPSSLPVEGAWRLAEVGTPASTFRDRFRVAVAHHSAGTLRCRPSRRGFHTDLQVSTGDFADWAGRMGWALPSPLPSLWRPVSANVGALLSDRSTAPGPTPAQSDRVRELEAAEVRRRQSTSTKAQHAATARWAGLEQHKLRAMELANSKPFPSRAKAAEHAREYIAKKEGSNELYSVQTIDDWLREGGWKKSSG